MSKHRYFALQALRRPGRQVRVGAHSQPADCEATSADQRLGLAQVSHRLWPELRRHRGLLVGGCVLTLLSAGLAQINPLVIRYLVDQTDHLRRAGASASQGFAMVSVVAVIFLAVAVAKTAFEFGQRQIGERLKVHLEQQLSSGATQHLLTLDASYFGADTNDSGRLAQRIERGAEGLAKMVKSVTIDLLPMAANAVGALIVMFTVNPLVGMVALGTLPGYALLAHTQATRQTGVRTDIKELREQRSGELLKVLASIRVVQSYVRETLEADRHQARSRSLALREIRHHLVNHICDALKTGLENVGALAVVIISAYLVLHHGMTIGIIPLHYMLYSNVTAPIRELHRVYTEYQEALVFSSGLFAVMDATPTVRNQPGATNPRHRASPGHMRLERVTFGYQADRPVLRDLDMELVPGGTTAVVGLSGAGKTTVAGLLPRFWDPACGRVLLDGVDIRTLDVHWLRDQIGMVLQNDHVFTGSIAENIRYGRLAATESEVADAASRAGLNSVLAKLDAGLDAPAHRLSGGERQRVALARAFLKDPPVIVLDEPTASLDAQAAEQIKRSIDELRRGRTVLVISHNPALFVDANRIYVLAEGQIVEHGDHVTLCRDGGQYASIIRANVESFNLEKLLEVGTVADGRAGEMAVLTPLANTDSLARQRLVHVGTR